MTPVFCCGFECIVAASGTGSPHWQTSTGVTQSTTTVRTGTSSLRSNAGGRVAASPTGTFAGARHIGRVYIRFTTLPSADTGVAYFGNATDGPMVRFKQSDSKLYAAVSTTLGATGASVTTGIWYRIDYDYNVNTGGADFCDVQVDGVALGQATATGTSVSQTFDSLGILSGAATGDIFYDDFL